MNYPSNPSQQLISMRLTVTALISQPLPFGANDLIEVNGTFFRVQRVTTEHETQTTPRHKTITLDLDWVPRDSIPDGTDVFGFRWAHDEISTLVH